MLLVRASASGAVDDEFVGAIRVTERLMDAWDVARERARTTVSMGRWLPERAARLTAEEIEAIRADVADLTAGTPMEELAEHNRQLISTLEEVQAHRDDLLRVNAELEETNKGVVALYSELSDELEATNRGVVALYAELDQRTTQVRQASDAKTRFLANVSHELRAPVTSIVGLTRLLQDPSSDPLTREQANQLQLIDTSARSLLALVNELLDLAKAESGRLEPVPAETDLKAVFDTLRGTMKAVAIAPSTVLVVVDPVDVPTIYTDPIMLTQILRNLLTNGLKFTPEGEVRLSAIHEPDTGRVALVVADTGIGIPAHEQERVFEEFHQVRHALQASVTGTGLGLPYARRLAGILGGEITLVSAPGRGSTFTLTIPVGDPSTVEGDRPADAPVRVLVADDDVAFRSAVVGVLRVAGLTVHEAADGRTTLAAIEARPPDVILLDLRMTLVDGLAVLDALSGDDALRQIPVVVLTAYPSDLVEHPALRRVTTVLDKGQTTLDEVPLVIRQAASSMRRDQR
jgi:signal transduction histidine kinase/CheY-like chemotaxis protein